MPVKYGDREAGYRFFIFQHPGGDSAADMPREMREEIGGREAERLSSEADGGSWILVADDRTEVRGMFPAQIEGELGGGLGIGGSSPATITIMNDDYKADRSFAVVYKAAEWVTVVDGTVVFRDEQFHPSYIGWAGDTGDFNFGF